MFQQIKTMNALSIDSHTTGHWYVATEMSEAVKYMPNNCSNNAIF